MREEKEFSGGRPYKGGGGRSRLNKNPKKSREVSDTSGVRESEKMKKEEIPWAKRRKEENPTVQKSNRNTGGG